MFMALLELPKKEKGTCSCFLTLALSLALLLQAMDVMSEVSLKNWGTTASEKPPSDNSEVSG